MNCFSWIIGHLANQERFHWVMAAQGQNLAPGLYKKVGDGRPASTPPLEKMWAVWHAVTSAADGFLDTLTVDQLSAHIEWRGKPMLSGIGTLLLRHTYHY